MSHFDEKLVNSNFKIIKFNTFFRYSCVASNASRKDLIFFVKYRYKSKKWKGRFEFCAIIGSEKYIFFFYWPHFLRFQKSPFSFSIKNFHRINSPPEKHWSPFFYVTVHLILIMLFRNTLNHAFEFKENCFHNKRGH